MVRLTALVLIVVAAVSLPLVAAQHCTTSAECSGDDECIAGACVPPVPDPVAYAAAAAGRESSDWWLVQYPAIFDPEQQCCFDLTGDAEIDDAYGVLLATFAFVIGVPNADILDEVELYFQSGEVVNVMDWRELAPDLSSGDVQVALFDGQLVDPAIPFVDRTGGLGHVLLERSSFGPYGAFSQMNTGGVSAGTVSIEGNHLVLPVVLLPVPEIQLATVHQPRLEAPMTIDDPACAGVCTVNADFPAGWYPDIEAGARIGGLLDAEEVYALIDSYYRSCSCAGIDPYQPVLQWNAIGGALSASCTANTGDWTGCIGTPCESLEWLCTLVPYYAPFLDFDQDDDMVLDAFTAGFRVAWSGTAIDGVTDDLFIDNFESGDLSGWSSVVP
jgi:hypothetical protein